MKITIKTALCTVAALTALTFAASAASIKGAYLEVATSAVGVELSGSHTGTGLKTIGAAGKTAVTTSYGLGWMSSRDRKMGLDFGYMWTPGEAKLSGTSDDTSSDVSMLIGDLTEYYIAPMLNISNNASLFLKFGRNSSDVKVTGDVTKITSMDGDTVSAGTVMSWDSNLYIRTEAGMTSYDKLTLKGLSTADANGHCAGVCSTETIEATPDVHFGRIAIGYKF